MLLAWLFSAILASVLSQVTGCKTSYDVWMTIDGIFNTRSRSRSRVLQLQNQLRNLRKEQLSVDDYFSKLTAMAEELREAGAIVDDAELSLIALNGLDEAYDSFVTSQTSRVEDISFSSLLGLLRTYDNRLSCRTELRVAAANAVQSSSATSTAVVCQICDKQGHAARGCFNRHNEQRFSSTYDKSRTRRFNKGGKSG